MVKFFGLILTTLCVVFQVNGNRMKIKSTNLFTNNYVNYEHSSDSLLETDIGNVSASYFENSNFNQSQTRMNTSNTNLKLKQKSIIPGNQYVYDYKIVNQKNSIQSANETNLLIRNLSSDTGRTIIEPTSSLAKPQNIDISLSVIQGNNNIRQLELKPGKLTDADVEEIRKKVLDKCNSYRNKHNFPEFVLNANMSQIAHKFAAYLVQGGDLNNRPKESLNYGENVYWTFKYTENLGEQAVDSWYKEIQLYDENYTEELLKQRYFAIYHFTQLLWKSTEKIGVGVSMGIDGVDVDVDKRSNGFYVVAYFDPKGNVDGEYLENLPRTEDTFSSSGQNLIHCAMGGLIIFLRIIL